MRAVVATGNPHKVEAIRRLLGPSLLELVDLSSFPDVPEPRETGSTFLENALLKGRYYAEKTGLPAFADDSGLEVDALDGRPGVHSSRFGGASTPHSEKMRLLLEMLQNTPDEERAARFRCAAALCFPDGREFTADGTMEGRIAWTPRGDGGFGYDPIVLLPEFDKTVAELSAEEKDSRSHRGRAFRKLLDSVAVEAFNGRDPSPRQKMIPFDR